MDVKIVPILEPGSKICTDCNQKKKLEEFGPNRLSRDGKEQRCRPCRSARNSAHRKANYDAKKILGYHLKRTYGITLAQYDTLLEAQGGGCACCGREPGRERLVVDHCHNSSAVRGLLCSQCNSALGFLGEDPERIKALLRYVEEL